MIYKDLNYLLERHRNQIRRHYTDYKSRVLKLIEKEVPIKDLIYFLKAYPGLKGAFNSLAKEADMYEVFDIIDDKLASYLHYEIFQDLCKKYCVSESDSADYSEHLINYMEKIDIKHYFAINSKLLEECTDESRKFTLKMDLAETTKLTRIIELENYLAPILSSISKESIMPSQIKLIDVRKGCLTLTYLVPAVVADAVLTADVGLSEEHIIATLRSLSVLSLKFGEIEVDCSVGKYQRVC